MNQDPMSMMLLLSGLNNFSRNIAGNAPPGGYQQSGAMGDIMPALVQMQRMKAEKEDLSFRREQAMAQQAAQQAAMEQRQAAMERFAREQGVSLAGLQLNPDAVTGAYADNLKGYTLGQGERRMVGNEEIAFNPKALEFLAGGAFTGNPNTGEIVGNPEAQAYGLRNSAAGAARTTVSPTTIYEATEGAFDKEIYGEAGKSHVALLNQAKAAGSRVNDLEMIDSLLDGLETGRVAEDWRLQAQKLLGIDLEGVGQREAATVIQNAAALKFRATGDGAGMPGSMSDADREFLRMLTPALETTGEGRKITLDIARADKKFEQGLAAAEGRYLQDRRKNGQSIDPYELQQFRAAYAEANPRYADLREKYADKGGKKAAGGNAPAGVSPNAAQFF